MQILITHGALARTRVLNFSWQRLVAAVAVLVCTLLLLSGAVYHYVFLRAVQEGWPVVSQLVRLVLRDELALREQVMQMNLDAMARKVGEMQARMVELEVVGERVGGLAGLKPQDLLPPPVPASASGRAPAASATGSASAPAPPASAPRAQAITAPVAPASAGGRGGPYLPMRHNSLLQLQQALTSLEQSGERHSDLLMLAEARLLESRLSALMVPSIAPVDVPVGSGFGIRTDPFTGRPALHTGLDFSADPGTPIVAAAGGVVASVQTHPQYGLLLEIDHGNGLSTRYAHCQRVNVVPGEIVRRGQPVAEVGTSGRSTGPHLHFEVLLGGVLQNPARFLASRAAGTRQAQAQPPERRVLN